MAGTAINVAAKVLEAYAGLSGIFKKNLEDAKERGKTYAERLEKATSSADIFKYLLLIDTENLDGYVAQTKLQAEQSFRLSRYVAIVGFIIIAAGVSLGIGTTLSGGRSLEAAYLSSLAGVLTEFISGVFFYLYNKTLQQMNVFHDKLLASKQLALNFLAESLKKREGTEQREEENSLASTSPKEEVSALNKIGEG